MRTTGRNLSPQRARDALQQAYSCNSYYLPVNFHHDTHPYTKRSTHTSDNTECSYVIGSPNNTDWSSPWHAPSFLPHLCLARRLHPHRDRRRCSRPRHRAATSPALFLPLHPPLGASLRRRHRDLLAQQRSHPRWYLLRRRHSQDGALHSRQEFAVRAL